MTMKYSVTIDKKQILYEQDRIVKVLRIEIMQEFEDTEMPRVAGYDEVKQFVNENFNRDLQEFQEDRLKPALEKELPLKRQTTISEPAAPLQEPLFYRYPDIEAARWQASKWVRPDDFNRTPSPGDDAWCRSDDPYVSELVRLVKKDGVGFAWIADRRMVCELSGEGGVFLSIHEYGKRRQER